jgi:REP element-mobilizing transposase RayT
MQKLHPHRTTWHITFGTYGTRLHGNPRPTVDRRHNQPGAPWIPPDASWEAAARRHMRFPPIRLTPEQCRFIQDTIPEICCRGGWHHRTNAAQPDHVHLLVDADPAIHGQKIRRLIKRWLTQALNARWTLDPDHPWWAEQGSNLAIHDEAYLHNAFAYIQNQRTPK